MQSATSNRRIVSIVLFVLAVILVLAGIVSAEFTAAGILLGLACAIVGIIFYRRGK